MGFLGDGWVDMGWNDVVWVRLMWGVEMWARLNLGKVDFGHLGESWGDEGYVCDIICLYLKTPVDYFD